MTEKVIEKGRGEAKGEHTTLKRSLSRPGRYPLPPAATDLFGLLTRPPALVGPRLPCTKKGRAGRGFLLRVHCLEKRMTAVSTPASESRWRTLFMSSNFVNGPIRTR